MVDVVLISPSPGGSGWNQATIEPPLGLGTMAGMLERQGYGCSIIDAYLQRLDPEDVLARIPESARLVGISVNSFSYTAASNLVSLLRSSRPGTTVILGGPLPSAAPDMILDTIACHGLVRGEGEYAIVRIVDNLVAGRPAFDDQVPGGMWRDPDTGAVKANPPERIMDLDALPFPAWHLLPPLASYKSYSRRHPVGAIMTSRGCAHACSFCSKDIFQRKVVFRSPRNVLEEIDILVRQHGVRQLDILDDNFAQNPKRMEAILDGIIAGGYDLDINFQSGIRAESLTDAILQKMKKAGVFKIAFGIESVEPTVLELCRKKLNVPKLVDAVRKAKKLGFTVYGFFIIGLPGETDEGFQKTLQFAKDMDFHVANFSMATPFIGTELFKQIEQGGRFLIDTTRNLDVGFLGGSPFFVYGDTTPEQVLRRYREAYKSFYNLGKKIRMLLAVRSFRELKWLMDAALSVH